MRALAQAGLSAEDALIALPDVMNLAVVGEMQLGAAALVATGIMHAFNLQLTDMPHIIDDDDQSCSNIQHLCRRYGDSHEDSFCCV